MQMHILTKFKSIKAYQCIFYEIDCVFKEIVGTINVAATFIWYVGQSRNKGHIFQFQSAQKFPLGSI